MIKNKKPGAVQNVASCQPFNKLILDLKTPSGRLTTFNPERHFEMHPKNPPNIF